MSVIDPARALQYADGDGDFADQMLADLKSKLQELHALLSKNLTDTDMADVARLAHRLVGVAGMVGADLLVESARAVALDHRCHDAIEVQLVDNLRQVVMQVLDELRDKE